MQDAAADEEEPSALEAAAAELDTQAGPAYFTDFFKCILHPQSVVQVPLLGSLQPPAGFGEITADEQIRRQVCSAVHAYLAVRPTLPCTTHSTVSQFHATLSLAATACRRLSSTSVHITHSPITGSHDKRVSYSVSHPTTDASIHSPHSEAYPAPPL